MPKRWADGLMLGTYHLPDGRVWTCDEKDRDYFFNRSKEILAAGIPLPVCLEHQPTVGMSHHDRLAEQTRNTAGHCHEVRVGDQGQIQYLVDADDEHHKIFERNKFFSPEIRQNVIDTRTGHRFPGPSVVHLACTPRPVQVTGQPHIKLSNRVAVSLSQCAVDVSLSAASYEPKKGNVVKPPIVAQFEEAMKKVSLSGEVHPAFHASGKASESSSKAHEATKNAKDPKSHAEAARHHGTAVTHHTEAAFAHHEAGNHDIKGVHIGMAKMHLAQNDHHMKEAFGSGSTSMSADATPPPKKKAPPAEGEPVEETEETVEPVAEPMQDPEGGGPITDTSPGAHAALIKSLSEVAAVDGIAIHTKPGMSLEEAVEHFITAFKTSQATKANKTVEGDNLNQPKPGQQEPEIAESPPIMMSSDDGDDYSGQEAHRKAHHASAAAHTATANATHHEQGQETGHEIAHAAHREAAQAHRKAAELSPYKHAKAHHDATADAHASAMRHHDLHRNPRKHLDDNTPEAEVAMSATTDPTVMKLAKQVVNGHVNDLRRRIGVLHKAGWYDDKGKAEAEGRLAPTVLKLSMADLTDEGVKPHEVSIEVATLEKLMNAGKPGPFAKQGRQAPPARTQPNPHKPISTALSADSPAISPDASTEDEQPVLIPGVMDKLSGGRWSGYNQQKNGKPV